MTTKNRITLATILCSTLAFTGCYVVPIQPGKSMSYDDAKKHVARATGQATDYLSVRLYPTNERAETYGVSTASIVRQQNDYAVFTADIGGKSFSGEATRSATNHNKGTANGTSNDGRYLNCTYEMNTPQMGSGQCKLSDGATFSIHISP